MTLGVTGFNLDVESFASAATHEFQEPAGPADAGGWQGGGGESRHSPPGGGRRRLTKIGRIGDPSPSSDGDRHLAALLGRELKTAGRCHRQFGDLADHAGQTAILQPLLHRPQDGRLVAGFGEDDALGGQTRLRQGRREEIALTKTPEHRAIRPRTPRTTGLRPGAA